MVRVCSFVILCARVCAHVAERVCLCRCGGLCSGRGAWGGFHGWFLPGFGVYVQVGSQLGGFGG